MQMPEDFAFTAPTEWDLNALKKTAMNLRGFFCDIPKEKAHPSATAFEQVNSYELNTFCRMVVELKDKLGGSNTFKYIYADTYKGSANLTRLKLDIQNEASTFNDQLYKVLELGTNYDKCILMPLYLEEQSNPNLNHWISSVLLIDESIRKVVIHHGCSLGNEKGAFSHFCFPELFTLFFTKNGY